MPVFLENYGMEFFCENEDNYMGLMSLAAKEGKAIKGYYDLPYFNKHFGDAQIILRTAKNTGSDGLVAEDIDTHSSGSSIWEVCVHGANIERTDKDLLSRRVAVTRLNDEGGLAVVNLVNADVLPSFLEGDIIKMQVIGLAVDIDYFENEEEYARSVPDTEAGEKYLIGEGAVICTGLLQNRGVDSPNFETDENLDDITAVRGTVKALYWGILRIEEYEQKSFIRCIIDTDFGELEIVHTVEQVGESMRDNMKVGATVSFFGVISGDVAIYEYEKGIVRDEEHNLAVLRSVFCGNDPERIRSVLTKNTSYFAEYNKETYIGADAIIERLKYVQRDNDKKHFAHMATIVGIKDGEEKIEYEAGKRCVVIATDEENNYQTIAFVEVDDDGNISEITTTENPRYEFSVD